jgi:hypothetical protein
VETFPQSLTDNTPAATVTLAGIAVPEPSTATMFVLFFLMQGGLYLLRHSRLTIRHKTSEELSLLLYNYGTRPRHNTRITSVYDDFH